MWFERYRVWTCLKPTKASNHFNNVSPAGWWESERTRMHRNAVPFSTASGICPIYYISFIIVHYRSLSLRASAWPAAKVEALEMRNLVSCLKRKRASWRKKGTSGAQVWQHQSNNDPNVQYRTVANINKYLACSGSNCSSLPIHGDPWNFIFSHPQPPTQHQNHQTLHVLSMSQSIPKLFENVPGLCSSLRHWPFIHLAVRILSKPLAMPVMCQRFRRPRPAAETCSLNRNTRAG